MPSAAQQPALPGRSAASLARYFPQGGRRLTTKGHAFGRFVALGFVGVNRNFFLRFICFARL
jgi:hypothetical protein